MEKNLLQVYEILLAEHGTQGWWPAEKPFEVCVGAILTQQTTWKSVEKAIKSLKNAELLSCKSISNAPISTIEKHIFSTGFYRQKSKRLKDFCIYLKENYNYDESSILSRETEEARDELLALRGIGKETADSMLLYAGEHPVFVVDAYTSRLVSRLKGKEIGGYDALQDLFHKSLPRNYKIFREYHALLVEHGKRYCTKTKPLCYSCPLLTICFFGER